MENSRDVLVLLTATYPFGRKSETFLDDEMPVLARCFSRVIVLPSQRDKFQRRMPEGVICDASLADIQRTRGTSEILMRCGFAARQFGRALVEEGHPRAYLGHPRIYFHLLGQNLLKYRALRSLIDRWSLREAVFYDYWLENSTLALSWLRREARVLRAVARAHRFDLYDETWEAGAVPFRAFKVAALDRVCTISEHGYRYLWERHPRSRAKLVLSRLGVTSPNPRTRQVRPHRDRTKVVVSCASLLPFKRVERIPEILERLGQPVSWVHFGDGPCRPEVERAARALPARVTWRLAGHVDHADVLQYYGSNQVDLFISLSESEGLPVSMMEAISFGIPLLATRVGGVQEIVVASTGTLVDVQDPSELIAAAARQLLDGDAPPGEEVRRFFEANFDAEKNFSEFAEMLHAV